MANSVNIAQSKLGLLSIDENLYHYALQIIVNQNALICDLLQGKNISVIFFDRKLRKIENFKGSRRWICIKNKF